MALRIPELAVLCALAHPNAASARAAIATLRGLPSDRADLYSRSITNALSPIEARILEKQMLEAPEVDYFTIFPNLCEHLRQRFLEEGREEGQLTALQGAALEMLRAKLGEVPPTADAAIRELQDAEVLTALLIELGPADGSEQALAAIAHAATRRSRTG